MAGTDKIFVKALYAYRGQNTDELDFQKGDIITITQRIDGGWWEGTLNERTGWFPSNYVKEFQGERVKSPTGKGPADIVKRESIRAYHNIVLQNIMETEKVYISELDNLLVTYLLPLKTSDKLNASDYAHLCGNIEEIVVFQKNFQSSLESCSRMSYDQLRAGGAFIKAAQKFKELYVGYCANHPKAVQVLTRSKDQLNAFMESHGAASPGVMILTTTLSLPFRRLAKYPIMLKEIERQVEENHIDRGDIQRSIAVFQEISDLCEQTRKQKNMELEVLTGSIRGWEGKPISSLGDILLMRYVGVISTPGGEIQDRCFVLFSDTLVILSASQRMSSYIYEGQVQLAGLSVEKLEDNDTQKFAIELFGSLIEKMVVLGTTCQDQSTLYDLLSRQIKKSQGAVGRHAVPKVITHSPSTPVTESNKPQAKAKAVTPQLPPHQGPQPFPPAPQVKPWNISRLRPAAPIRPQIPLSKSKEDVASPRIGRRAVSPRTRNTKDDKMAAGDQIVLQVIEAYCTSAKTRYTINSTLLDSPQVLIAEDEKIIVEEKKGNQIVMEEKSLVDTVYALKDKVNALDCEVSRMSKVIEEEKRARKRLETLLRKSVRSLVEINFDESHGQVTL